MTKRPKYYKVVDGQPTLPVKGKQKIKKEVHKDRKRRRKAQKMPGSKLEIHKI